MSDRGDVVEWVATTEDEVIIIEEYGTHTTTTTTTSSVLQASESSEAPTTTTTTTTTTTIHMQKLLDTMVQGEDADFDDGFYCDECRSLFQERSGVCIAGPSFILDSPTDMAVPQRALLTLPHGLMIGRSSVPDAGLGVMNQGPAVTPGMHFGPVEGEATSREEAMASRCSWEIFKGNDEYDYIDASRETHSNWMRYVNCARSPEESNLLAVQCKGSILFHCCRTVHPGDELLVWPSGGLLGCLSDAWDHLWHMKLPSPESNPGITGQIFLCPRCPLSFTTETYCQRHADHFHATDLPPKGDDGGAEATEPQNQNPNQDADTDTATAATVPTVEAFLVLDAFEAKTCAECGKIFKHTHHLKRHVLSVHSNKRPYCCPRCRRSFSQASGLLRHQLVHKRRASSGEGEEADETEMETGGSPSLPDTDGGAEAAAVVVTSQDLPPLPPGTEEATVAELKPVCESHPLEEAKGTAVAVVVVAADGEKRTNACAECDKSFSSGHYLEKHRTRVHSDVRPYVCTLCRKTFGQHSDLARHLKSHRAKEKDGNEGEGEAAEEDEELSSEESGDDSRDQDRDKEDRDFVVAAAAAEPSAPKTPEVPEEPAYRRPQRVGARSRISAITRLIAPKRKTPAVNKRKSQSPARVVAESAEEPDVHGGAYSCGRCKLKHETEEALKTHVCGAAASPHKCARCGAAFKKAGFLKRHERTAHHTDADADAADDGRPYSCDVCGKAFGKLFNLKQHQKVKSCGKHHCTSEIFSCDHCPFSFTIRSYLRKHVRRHHPAEYLTLSEAERPAEDMEDDDDADDEEVEGGGGGVGVHVCPKCGKKYATAKTYTAHRCVQQVILYLCTDCGKGFSNHYSLKQHQRVHSGLRPHVCPHCHKTFVHMGQLNVHLRTHTGERPYLCTHCGESFRQSGDLKRHERKHTGVRPHSCPECFKSFSRPQSLRAHQLLHRGQRMFKCDECGKSFSRNYHLRRHQHKMHS